MDARSLLIAGAVLFLPPHLEAATFRRDPPWNPAHLQDLPADIRRAVLARCPAAAAAGHYFATYYRDDVHLHFEHFYCPNVQFCDRAGCLHQTYRLMGGHYRLLKTFYGPAND